MGIYQIKYAALSELLHARITRRQGRATSSVGLGIKVDCKSAASASVISLQLVSSMSDKAATNKVRLGAMSAHLAVQFVTQGCSANKPCTCAPLGPCDAWTSTGRLVVLEAQVGRWCGMRERWTNQILCTYAAQCEAQSSRLDGFMLCALGPSNDTNAKSISNAGRDLVCCSRIGGEGTCCVREHLVK